MSADTSPSGDVDINHLTTDYFVAKSPVITASNATDWSLTLVLRDMPNTASPVDIAVWWQSGATCSSGAIVGQTFASGAAFVPVAVDKLGVALTVPRTVGTINHTFGSGEFLCLSIANLGAGGTNDIHIYADTASTSGDPGLSRLEGPFTLLPTLNLQRNGIHMSFATSPSGNVDINYGTTDYFVATSPVTTASNAADWNLTLVLRDKPDTVSPVDIAVWWQSGGACSSGAITGQTLASGSVFVPIAVDKLGVALTVPKTGGTINHTFGSGETLCLSIANTIAGGADIHIYADTDSTSGVPGFSRLEGPFT